MTTFHVAIPRTLPTPNSRMHWSDRSPLVAQIRTAVAVQARIKRIALRVPVAIDKRSLRLQLIRGKGQKLLDPDNCVAALKPVVDGLKDAGWIVDDSQKWLEYSADQARGKQPGVVVTVEECAALMTEEQA